MQSFEFHRAQDAITAMAAGAKSGTAQQGASVRFVAGGTTLLDLMKLNVERPGHVIDINRLPLDKVEPLADGGLKIGATVLNSHLANHPIVQRDYAVLSQVRRGTSPWMTSVSLCCGNSRKSSGARRDSKRFSCKSTGRLDCVDRCAAVARRGYGPYGWHGGMTHSLAAVDALP